MDLDRDRHLFQDCGDDVGFVFLSIHEEESVVDLGEHSNTVRFTTWSDPEVEALPNFPESLVKHISNG